MTAKMQAESAFEITQPSAARRRRVPLGENPGKTNIVRIAVLIAFLALWSITPDSMLPEFAFGRPSTVLASLWRLFSTGAILPPLFATTQGVIFGLLIAAPIGVLLGILCSNRYIRWVLWPIVTAGNAVPKLGLISILIIMFGVGLPTRLSLVVLITTFVFFYGTLQAIGSVEERFVTAARLMGASRMKIWRSIYLRFAVPQMLGAIRVALPLGFSAEIFAELSIPTAQGIGVTLHNYQDALNGAVAMACLIVIAAIGYMIDIVLGAQVRRYTESIGVGVK